MITTTRRLAVLTAALAAGLLAACGGGSGSATGPTVGTLIPQMQSAVAHARSVRMSGSGDDAGQHVTLDLIFAKPAGLEGTFSEGSKSFSVLQTAGKSFVKIDQQFLTQSGAPSTVCATLCGKYVAIPSSSTSSLTSGLSLSALYSQVISKFPVKSTSKDVFTPTTYHGQAAYRLAVRQGTIVVASSSPHYPLAITSTGQGAIEFSQWDTASVPGPPPASQVVNPSRLG